MFFIYYYMIMTKTNVLSNKLDQVPKTTENGYQNTINDIKDDINGAFDKDAHKMKKLERLKYTGGEVTLKAADVVNVCNDLLSVCDGSERAYDEGSYIQIRWKGHRYTFHKDDTVLIKNYGHTYDFTRIGETHFTLDEVKKLLPIKIFTEEDDLWEEDERLGGKVVFVKDYDDNKGIIIKQELNVDEWIFAHNQLQYWGR